MDKDVTNLNLNISSELKVKLDILALENHTSVNDLILSLLDNHVCNEFDDDTE